MYFAIGIYVKEQMNIWNEIEFNSKNIEMLDQPVVKKPSNLSRNSDMDEEYF